MRRTTAAATFVASVALAVALVPGLTTVAHEGNGSTSVVHACYSTTTKVVKIAPTSASAQCPAGSKPLHWSKTGPKGATGAQGAKGDTGAKGDDGSPGGATGPQGPQGDTGDKGAKGNAGDTGVQGNQGVKGDTGSQGATGPQGATGQGIQGDTGAQGTQGNQGDTGVQGNQGDTGAQGSQGATGAQGATGPQGATGAQGNQGDAGITGNGGVIRFTSNTGVTNNNCFSLSGGSDGTCPGALDQTSTIVVPASGAFVANLQANDTVSETGTIQVQTVGGTVLLSCSLASGSCQNTGASSSVSAGTVLRVRSTGGALTGQIAGSFLLSTNNGGGNVGPQGPQGDTGSVGPQGSTGPTGATGTTGATGAATPTGYEIISSTSTSSSSDKSDNRASCSTSSKRIIGGGASVTITNGDVAIYDTHPVDAATDYWTASAAEAVSNAGNWTITTYAICVD